MDLLASGMGNRDIARHLQIAEKTVRNHINHIFSKLGLSERSHLIVLARDAGFGSGGQGQEQALSAPLKRALDVRFARGRH